MPPTAHRTVHVGANLFPESVEGEGPPLLLTPVEERVLESKGVKAALMAMRDSVVNLTTRVNETERRAAHNLPGMGFEERGGPFTKIITQTLRSHAAKPLKLSYGGEGDPHLFLDSFKSHTNAKDYSDAMCCNMFQETLSGEALSWFYELPAGSIDSFRQLADRFVNRFILRMDGQSTPQLFKVKQGQGEGLKAFVNRWQGATAKMRNFDKKVAEEAFYVGKRKEDRRSESQGQTIQEVRTWKGDQEGQGFTPSKRYKAGGRKQAKQVGGPQGKGKGGYQDGGFKAVAPAARENFTTLMATPEVVWNENKGVILGPPMRKFPPSRLTREDNGKYCGYHGEATHAINNCVELKKAIEGQLKGGKLQQYAWVSRRRRGSGLRDDQHYPWGSTHVKVSWRSVTFEEGKEQGIRQPHEDPFLVTAQLDHYLFKKILIDIGASVNVLFKNAWQALRRGNNKVIQDNELLISFSEDVVQPLGSNHIPVILESVEGNTLTTGIDFIVVDCDSSYNGILGRPTLWKVKAFIAGHILLMKLPFPAGIVTIWGDQLAARGCYAIDQDNGRRRAEVLVSGNPVTLVTDAYEDPRINAATEGTEAEKPGSIEETELICISNEFLARTARIGTGLPPGVKEELKCPRDLERHSDTPVGNPKGVPLVRQKRRSFDLAKYDIIKGEVQRLLDIQFIKEARYPQWLANVVMVPKKVVGQWRMCVDYTSLNRACPKDSFPLPRIDQLVDSTSEFEMLSFMDAYAGYNQIMMNTTDEEHTAFTIDKGVYYYKRMPFNLKNA
ncbi:PREDICTED: uncharacterized protein LOC101311121 [Fragaria vesca subsp. vesca]